MNKSTDFATVTFYERSPTKRVLTQMLLKFILNANEGLTILSYCKFSRFAGNDLHVWEKRGRMR